jgi:hypothetical protein
MKKRIISLVLCQLVFAFFTFASGKGNDSKYFSKPYIKSVMEKAAYWQLAHPKHELYDWTNGAFMPALALRMKRRIQKRSWTR